MLRVSRKLFFNSSKIRLLQAATAGYNELHQECAHVNKLIVENGYHALPFIPAVQLDGKHDNVARTYLQRCTSAPIDVKTLDTLSITALGDCMFAAVSKLCTNTEDYQCELRVKTAIEMCLFHEHYTSDDNLKLPKGSTELLAIISPSDSFQEDFVKFVYREECCRIVKDKEWGSMWHLIKRPIMSLYPDINGQTDAMQHLMNGIIMPRVLHENSVLHILWSHTEPYESGYFNPNHVAACLLQDTTNVSTSRSISNPTDLRVSYAFENHHANANLGIKGSSVINVDSSNSDTDEDFSKIGTFGKNLRDFESTTPAHSTPFAKDLPHVDAPLRKKLCRNDFYLQRASASASKARADSSADEHELPDLESAEIRYSATDFFAHTTSHSDSDVIIRFRALRLNGIA